MNDQMRIETLQAEKATLQAENTALEAEKSALKTQVVAKDSEMEILRAKSINFEKQVGTLESEKKENDRAIKDGQAARTKAVDACVEAFGKTEPTLPEAELTAKADAERASLETLSLEQIYNRTEGYVSFAEKLYPEGRQTKEPVSPDKTQQSGGKRKPSPSRAVTTVTLRAERRPETVKSARGETVKRSHKYKEDKYGWRNYRTFYKYNLQTVYYSYGYGSDLENAHQ